MLSGDNDDNYDDDDDNDFGDCVPLFTVINCEFNTFGKYFDEEIF